MQPKVRVLGSDIPSSELFNFYQLTSLMASMYVKATDCEGLIGNQKLWAECSSLVVDQVALAFKWWEKVEKQRQDGLTLVTDLRVADRSRHLVNRCIVAEKFLNDWVFADRWTKFAVQAERSYLEFGLRLISRHDCLKLDRGDFESLVLKRREILKTVSNLWLNERLSIQRNYAVPINL